MESSAGTARFDQLADRLRLLFGGLRAEIGAWGLEAVLTVLLHGRVSRLWVRLERMLERFRAGQIRPRPPRMAAPDGAGQTRARRAAPEQLPCRSAWLVVAVGYRAAAYGSQLQHALNTEEMGIFLSACPQAMRLLRPLCRALAVDVPAQFAPPRGPRAETPPRPARVRPKRPKPEPFRIPLPRGVISAARRAGFGRMR